MTDGAHAGYSAEQAMKAAIGGEQPETRATADEMRDRIVNMTQPAEFTYDSCADWTAHLILEWLIADPRRAQTPSENVYKRDDSGDLVFESDNLVLVERGWYDRMKDDGYDLAELGLSGFMWGWAVNAARRCLELAPVPNPALMTISVEQSV